VGSAENQTSRSRSRWELADQQGAPAACSRGVGGFRVGEHTWVVEQPLLTSVEEGCAESVARRSVTLVVNYHSPNGLPGLQHRGAVPTDQAQRFGDDHRPQRRDIGRTGQPRDRSSQLPGAAQVMPATFVATGGPKRGHTVLQRCECRKKHKPSKGSEVRLPGARGSVDVRGEAADIFQDSCCRQQSHSTRLQRSGQGQTCTS